MTPAPTSAEALADITPAFALQQAIDYFTATSAHYYGKYLEQTSDSRGDLVRVLRAGLKEAQRGH